MNRLSIWLASIAVIVMVILTAEQVFARYLFKASSIAVQELQWHLFGFVFLVSAAATLEKNQHVRVDIFYGNFSHRRKACVDLVGTLIFLMPSMAVLVWYGWTDVLAARSYANLGIVNSNEGLWGFLLRGEGSPNPGGLPARWIVKSFLPLGAILVMIQGVVIIGQALKTLSREKNSNG